jgi:hypothetical protein
MLVVVCRPYFLLPVFPHVFMNELFAKNDHATAAKSSIENPCQLCVHALAY